MTGRLDTIAWHTCPECGKRGYSSRKRAKKILNRMRANVTGMSVYECHYVTGVFHFGRTPTAVRRGYATRDQITQRRRA